MRILYSIAYGPWKCKWLTEFGDPNFVPAHGRPLRIFCKKRPKEGGAEKRLLGDLIAAGKEIQRRRYNRSRWRTSPSVDQHRVLVVERDASSPRRTQVRWLGVASNRETGSTARPRRRNDSAAVSPVT